MNKQQVEYVATRLRGILSEKQSQVYTAARAKLPPTPKPVTYVDVHKAILSGNQAEERGPYLGRRPQGEGGHRRAASRIQQVLGQRYARQREGRAGLDRAVC